MRYVHDGTIMEDFLFCEDLKRSTKAKDIFYLFYLFKKLFTTNQIVTTTIQWKPKKLGKTSRVKGLAR